MFDNIIKALRVKRNFTQEEMADTLNISQNAYSLIETGKTMLVDKQRIKLIAEKLNVSPSELGLFDGMGIGINYNDKVNNNYNLETIHTEHIELITALREQLAIKDKRIEQLLSLLGQKQ